MFGKVLNTHLQIMLQWTLDDYQLEVLARKIFVIKKMLFVKDKNLLSLFLRNPFLRITSEEWR